MRKPGLLLTVALCAVLVLLPFCQVALASGHAHDDCHVHADGCLVCLVLQGVRTLLRALALLVAACLALDDLALAPLFPAPRAHKHAVASTLVTLRVRLNP